MILLNVQISAKEDKHKKEIILLAVNRIHPEYTSFKPGKRLPESLDQKHDASSGENRQSRLQLEVVEIYKSSTHVNPIFTSVGADTGGFYTAPEAANVVFRCVLLQRSCLLKV